jgi:hypothetical protein
MSVIINYNQILTFTVSTKNEYQARAVNQGPKLEMEIRRILCYSNYPVIILLKFRRRLDCRLRTCLYLFKFHGYANNLKQMSVKSLYFLGVVAKF